MSNLSQGNLMRNPGSDIDLAALYNNDSSKSMGFSLPNVPWPSAAGQCQFGYGVSSWVAQNQPKHIAKFRKHESGKGQLISECLFGVLNFPKKQGKI